MDLVQCKRSLIILIDALIFVFFLFRDLELPAGAKEKDKQNNFDLQGYQIKIAQKEQTRPERLVRIGAIQNAIPKPTTTPVQEQVGSSSSTHLQCEKVDS